jgi:tetratricopeptide (TPR) repeat protein
VRKSGRITGVRVVWHAGGMPGSGADVEENPTPKRLMVMLVVPRLIRSTTGGDSRPPRAPFHRKPNHCEPVLREPSLRTTGRPLAAGLLGLGLFLTASISTAADLAETTRLFRTGEYAACAEAAAEGIAASEYNENFRTLKLRSELALGRYADALASLDAALAKLPYSVQVKWLGIDVCRFNDDEERAARLNAEIAELVRQQSWRYGDVVNEVVLAQYLLANKVDPKQVLDGLLADVKRRQPGYVEAWLVRGHLALAKHDYQLAGDAFQQAVKLDAENADAHYGVARAFAPSDGAKAEEALQLALEKNPRHVESLLLLADEQIDAEQYEAASQRLTEATRINPHHPRALALRAVIGHLQNQPDQEQRHREAALKHWTKNPEVDHLIGRKLSQKYRFAEGESYQRKALELDPGYLPAKMQLADDLLRLGREEEGLVLAEEVYAADTYNIHAYNLVTLQESLARFRTLEEDGILVRMEAREADLYGSRVMELFQRAKATLAPKYEVELEGPIIVEIFPRQQDFAIRTFGLPGGAGFLGVCFGTVITANSPASQGASPSNWEATLWHEFCHVVTLTKTKNKMPRWLSEGISVYEERQADPTWGQTMNPQYRAMLLGDDLVPVSELSGAFLAPQSALHLQFAYYESSLAVEFLIEKYGLDTLKRVLVDLGVGMPINESLARYTGSLAALDAEFAKFARERAGALAPEADWSEPELPQRASAELITDWLKDHPNNYLALQRLAQAQVAAKDWNGALATADRLQKLYPGDGSSAGSHALAALVHRERGDKAEERAALDRLAALVDDDLATFARLGELAAEAENWELARTCALRQLAVNPLLPAPHRSAARAAEELNDWPLAVASYTALLRLDPLDPADLHLRLSQTLTSTGDLTGAKRHALWALEETPRFRAAQDQLLKVLAQLPATELPVNQLPATGATERPAESPTTEPTSPSEAQPSTTPPPASPGGSSAPPATPTSPAPGATEPPPTEPGTAPPR